MSDYEEPYHEPDPIREHSFERSLPHSSDAEKASLGHVILDNNHLATLIDLVKPEDYYVPAHRRILVAMIALFERGSEINPILISEELKKENLVEAVGGISFITNLTYGLPHATNIENYAKIIAGKALLRRLVKTANKITNEALEEEDEPQVIYDHATKEIFDLGLSVQQKSWTPVQVSTYNSLDKAFKIQQKGKPITGVTTGLLELDELTLGLQKSDLILCAARPSIGKTAFALQVAVSAAKAGETVAVFELEMSEESIAMRMLCNEARIDTRRYRTGYLSETDWSALSEAHEILSRLELYTDDTPGITVTQLKSKAMRLKQQTKKLGLIVIDYVQLMKGNGKSLYEQTTAISKELKTVARELDIPLLALSQLNRGPESRTDHRPTLADLRDSGAMEQDADVVLMLYRADKYRSYNEPKDNTAEIICTKQRNGPTDTVFVRFDSPCTRFDNLTR